MGVSDSYGEESHTYSRCRAGRSHSIRCAFITLRRRVILRFCLVPGFHLLLYSICVYFALSKRIRLHMMMFAGISIMILLTITDIGITWDMILNHRAVITAGDSFTLLKRARPKYVMFVTNMSISTALVVRGLPNKLDTQCRT